MSKIFDLTHDSIELRALPPGRLNRRAEASILPKIPDGFVEVTVRAGGEILNLWLTPEDAEKLAREAWDKSRAVKAHEYDPS